MSVAYLTIAVRFDDNLTEAEMDDIIANCDYDMGIENAETEITDAEYVE